MAMSPYSGMRDVERLVALQDDIDVSLSALINTLNEMKPITGNRIISRLRLPRLPRYLYPLASGLILVCVLRISSLFYF